MREPGEPALRVLEPRQQRVLRERVLPEQQALPRPAQVQREQRVPESQRLVPPEASGRDAGRPALRRDVQPRWLLWGRRSTQTPAKLPWELRTIRALVGRRAPRRWMMPILRTRLAL